MTRQKLVTREVLKEAATPSLDGRRADPSDVKVPLKLFNPAGAGSWYVTEYDPADRLFFGYAEITDGELGYFGLDELEEFRGPLGVGIERDLYWDESTSLADVVEGRVR